MQQLVNAHCVPSGSYCIAYGAPTRAKHGAMQGGACLALNDGSGTPRAVLVRALNFSASALQKLEKEHAAIVKHHNLYVKLLTRIFLHHLESV